MSEAVNWRAAFEASLSKERELRVVVEGLRTQLADALSQQTQDWEANAALGAQVAAVKALLDTPHDTEAGNDCTACNLPRLIRAALESRLG